MSISRAMYDHWMAISVALRNPPTPGQTPSAPVVPDPPGFPACIAHLQATLPAHQLSTGQLKAECRRDYTDIQSGTLKFLISAYWTRSEAVDQGIAVSDADVQRRFDQIKQQSYRGEADFQKFLASSDQTVPDLLFSVKTQMLSVKIQQKITKGNGKDRGKATQSALSFAQSSLKKWASKTSCSPGFIVESCKEFK